MDWEEWDWGEQLDSGTIEMPRRVVASKKRLAFSFDWDISGGCEGARI